MPSKDIVDLLSEEHAVLRGLASAVSVRIDNAVKTSRDDARIVYLELSDRVIRHEIAEELIVYPAISANRRASVAGAFSRIDHSEVESLLIYLDRQEFGSSEFESGKTHLLSELLTHLAREEEELHPALISYFTRDERDELADRFRQVVRAVPLLTAESRAHLPIGPTVVSRTSALAVWMRDLAHSAGLAG